MSSKPYESNLKSLSPSDVRAADMDYRADWNESDPDNPSYISNKPDDIVNMQADWSQTDNTKLDYIKNKPSIPEQVQADWNTVSSDAKSYIKNKPTTIIPATVPTNAGTYILTVEAAVDEGDPVYSWEAFPAVPAAGGSDATYVLKVASDGTLSWVAAS